jgi:hypothetical protein
LRRHQDAAVGIAIAAMASVILATLHWSNDARRMRPVLDCGPLVPSDPAADGNSTRYALYLVRGATSEEVCERALRQWQTQSPDLR